MNTLKRAGNSAVVALVALLSTCPAGRDARAQDRQGADDRLPPGAGLSLVLEACVQCHDLRPLFAQRKTEPVWRRTVDEMVWRGASLMPGEAEVLTRYLAAAFGPEHRRPTAPRVSREVQSEEERELARFLPPGTGRAVVVGACMQCHGLMLTVSQRKTLSGWRRSVEQMARLGARLNGREADVVAQYLARSFGPDDPIPDAIKRHPGFFIINQQEAGPPGILTPGVKKP